MGNSHCVIGRIELVEFFEGEIQMPFLLVLAEIVVGGPARVQQSHFMDGLDDVGSPFPTSGATPFRCHTLPFLETPKTIGMPTSWKSKGIHHGFREANEAGRVVGRRWRFVGGIPRGHDFRLVGLGQVHELIPEDTKIDTVDFVTFLPVLSLARCVAVKCSVATGAPHRWPGSGAIAALDVFTTDWELFASIL